MGGQYGAVENDADANRSLAVASGSSPIGQIYGAGEHWKSANVGMKEGNAVF